MSPFPYDAWTIAFTCIYTAGMFFFTIAFLIDWIVKRAWVRRYWRYGVGVASVILAFDVLILILNPSAFQNPALLCFIPLADALVFLRATGFTMLGIFYAAQLGLPSFPLIFRLWPLPPAPAPEANPASLITTAPAALAFDPTPQPPESPSEATPPIAEPPGLISDEPPLVTPTPERPPASPPFIPAEPHLTPLNPGSYVLHVLGVAAGGILYSTALFWLTKPTMSDLLKNLSNTTAQPSMNVPLTVLTVLAFALAEEIFFRLGIQNFLTHQLKLTGRQAWVAITLTALLWMTGHAGTLTPEWVKFAQIFPMGLALGWLYRKYGVESCICAHGLFNVSLALISGMLVK